MSGQWKSYAHALYELAAEESLDGVILEQLETLDQVFMAEPDFLRLLSSPNLSKEEQCGIASDVLNGKVHPYVQNTLLLLTKKGAVRQFSGCCKEYRALYDDAHGILAVTALTAIPLSEEQTHRLAGKLESVTGKTIRIRNLIDPSCMGGVRLDYDGKRLDGTVQGRLASIGEHLKNTIL